MDVYRNISNLSFEVKIIRVKNIELKSAGDLFVRCYLPAGINKRVKLNTKQIPSKSDLYFDEKFSLSCFGDQESINSLKQQGDIVLELRLRKTTLLPFLGGSKLLARAEIPWRYVFDSPNMEIETWVCMMNSRRSSWNEKPPKVQVSMKIKILEERTKMAKKLRKWDECGCTDGGCNSCKDYDFYAIGFALEGLL